MAKKRSRRRKRRPLSQIVGERIQALREAKDWSRTELARQGKISLTNLNLIEQGRVEARLGTLATLASTLGVRVADLLDDEPPPPRPKMPSAAFRRLMARLQDHREDEVYLRTLDKIAQAVDQALEAGG